MKRISLPYTRAESFFYDRVIAPAVASVAARQAGRFISAVPENGSVLDVGCGGGQLICLLRNLRPDLQVSGLDLSGQQVRRATERTRIYGSAVDIKQGSALQMRYDDCSFDLVISVGSIKHWPDQAKGLRECVRVLKPGGRLLVFELDKDCDPAAATEFVRSWRLPAAVRPLAQRFFMKYVAGNSLNLGDAEKLAAQLPAAEAGASRLDSFPAWIIHAVK